MMTPHYDSIGKKERQFVLLPFLQNKKIYWLFSLFLLNLNFVQAQVVISEVFADGSFELRNTGTATVDISSYWICNRPDYEALSTLAIECGSLFLAAGDEVVLKTTIFGGTDDELGLYLTNNGGFSQASEIISYVEWGTAGGGRSELATGKGIWDGNAVANFVAGESLVLNGTGTVAADWGVNTNPQKCVIPPPPASTSSARYQVTFNAAWSATTHPTDFPSSAHFSGLIGLTHTSNVALFELGGTASPGIVSMAETGSKNSLTTEIQTIIDGGQGQTLVSGGGIGTSPGSVAVEFNIENSHPLVSVTTMIAPSPDWFVGVRGLDLFEGGDWVNTKTVEVATYDAGSDSGTTFTSSNQATSPQGTITMINDGPLVIGNTIPSMGTLTFTRLDMGMDTCAVGGTLTGDAFTFCVDGIKDTIPADGISLSGNTGEKSQWVVTDGSGTILGLPASFTGPDFDAAGTGVCFVWHLSYEDSLAGLAMGKSVDSLMGCYNFSNSIKVTREVCADSCMVTGGMLTGDTFTFCVDGIKDTIPADGITLNGNTGTNNQWVITDGQGNILGLPPTFSAPDFDAAGAGVCFVWNLAYEDGLTGLEMGKSVDSLMGCFNLSNSIKVTRQDCGDMCVAEGGTLAGGPYTFCVDGVKDTIPADGITLSGNTGGNSQWVVTDGDGKILGLPLSFTGPDFDAAGSGVCFVWHLSYEDGLTGLAMGENVSQLAGCYNLSNSVQVTREVCPDPCTAPSDVVVEVLGARKINVNWEDVPNAARYLIEIRFVGKTRVIGRGLIRRSRVHIFAPSGRNYEFQIKTICADGSESPFTDWIPFSTPGNAVATAESRNAETFIADISIDEVITKELTVFPNPVNDLVQVNYTISGETATLELFHVSGKRVVQQTLSNTTNNHELNMSNYSNGLYLMTITEQGEAPITKRIVKGSLR